jgi:hypothetical protein
MIKIEGYNGFVNLFSSINVYSLVFAVRMVGTVDMCNGA